MGMFTMNHNYKIPKSGTDLQEDYKIWLPYYEVELISKKSSLPSKKSIQFINKEKYNIGTLILDERSSTMRSGGGFDHPTVLKIHQKFLELKKSNVNYGNIGSGDEYEYEGSENLTIEIFFDYLKSENREQIINHII